MLWRKRSLPSTTKAPVARSLDWVGEEEEEEEEEEDEEGERGGGGGGGPTLWVLGAALFFSKGVVCAVVLSSARAWCPPLSEP